MIRTGYDPHEAERWSVRVTAQMTKRPRGLSEENRRLRGLLALALVVIEEHLASPEAATKHLLALHAALIKEALSPTTEHL